MIPISFPDLNLIVTAVSVAGLMALFLVLLGYVLLVLFRHRGREARSVDSVLLQVAVPRGNETKIDAMEQVFASLYSIKKGGWKQKFGVQPAISFEIVAKQEDIRFYVWTPKKLQDLVEKQINGGFADAEIKEVPEYNIFKETGKVAYKSLQLSKANFYPLKTFKDLATDPLAALTSALAKMGPEEGAAIQILVSPAESAWQKAGGKFIADTKKQESDPEKAKFATPAKTLEAVENKIGKPGFETSIRIVVVSATEEVAKSHLENITSSFSQVASDTNNLKKRKIISRGAFMEDFLYRYPLMFNVLGNRPSVLNSEELATIYHFPNKQVTTPHIFWLYSKTAPAPADIPTEGLFLGASVYRGLRRNVYIADEDRLRHMYIVGKTGVGKSQLMLRMMLQDIRAGKGICFIDPHDTVRDLLTLIPPERA